MPSVISDCDIGANWGAAHGLRPPLVIPVGIDELRCPHNSRTEDEPRFRNSGVHPNVLFAGPESDTTYPPPPSTSAGAIFYALSFRRRPSKDSIRSR